MVPGLSIPLDHHVRTCAPATRSEVPAVRAAPARELLAFTPTIRLHGPRWLLILLLVISRFTPAAGGALTAALKQALLAGKDLIDDDGMTLGRGRVSMFAGPPAACDPCWVTAGKAPLPLLLVRYLSQIPDKRPSGRAGDSSPGASLGGHSGRPARPCRAS